MTDPIDLGIAARLVVGVRNDTARRTACTTWGADGTAAAMRATGGSHGSLYAAALLTAEDPTVNAPSPAAFRNRWPVNATSQPRISYDVPCTRGHAGQVEPCPTCRAERDRAPEPPGSVEAAIDECRRAIAEGKARVRARDNATANRPGLNPEPHEQRLAAARARAETERNAR
jgi:hypothetical protein